MLIQNNMHITIDTINKNIQKYEQLLKEFRHTSTKQAKLFKACNLLYFLTHKGTGRYVDEELEEYFCSLANEIDVELKPNYNKNKVLHVVTEAYATGGHTRVMERWVHNTNHIYENHIAILNQQAKLPLSTKDLVASENLHILPPNIPLLEKAKELRVLASDCAYIVLHIHMYDPISTIAFGTKKFTRPIIFFNHADHMFSIGMSIADIVAELSESRLKSTKNYRGCSRTAFIGIPTELVHKKHISKHEARKKLGIDPNKKIVMALGSAHKFFEFQGNSLLNFIAPIIERDDTIMYFIGLDENALGNNINTEKIKILPAVDYTTEYFYYLKIADVILDTWPMGGGALIIDATLCDVPVLALNAPFEKFDFITSAEAFCKTPQEFIQKINQVLDEPMYGEKLLVELQKNLESLSVDAWTKRLEHIVQQLPKEHSIYEIEQHETKLREADFLIEQLYGNVFMSIMKHNIPNILSYSITHIPEWYVREFKFLGLTIRTKDRWSPLEITFNLKHRPS